MKKRGFTLVELVAVLGILSIISVILYSIFSNGEKMYSTGAAQTKLQDTARTVIFELTSSINNAQSAQTINIISNQLTVDGKTFNNVGRFKGLVYIKPNSNPSNPYIYAIKNNGLYKIFLDGTGTTSPIDNNINLNTSIDTPMLSAANIFRIRISLTSNTFTKSYTTFASIGGD